MHIAQFVELSPVQRLAAKIYPAFVKLNKMLVEAADREKTESVLGQLDARTLYDVGVTDILSAGPDTYLSSHSVKGGLP